MHEEAVLEGAPGSIDVAEVIDRGTLGVDAGSQRDLNGVLDGSPLRQCEVARGAQRVHLCAVQRYYTDAEAFYRAESLVDRLAKARGFSKSCVAVIGDSAGNIAAEGRLAQDLRSAVSALQQQNPNALQTLSGQIQADIRAIKPGPSQLSLCPHQ